MARGHGAPRPVSGARYAGMGRRACRRACVGLAAVLTLIAACADRRDPQSAFLEDAWAEYLTLYVHPDGYVLDPDRDAGSVTSEGQGYAMLRAVWERDEPTFRRLAAWTRAHLQRSDGLHSWLWTPRDGGRIVDENTATDGDMEIAWALLMAADVFGDPADRAHGARIVRAVRTASGLPVRDKDGTTLWFPAAGNWAVDERIANLSYFVPYAHPWFAAVDPGGNWDQVTELGYDILQRWLEVPAHSLPPAFFTLTQNGEPEALPPTTELEVQFSFDAVRLFWRIEADCRLHGDQRGCADPLDVGRTLPLLTGPSGVVSAYEMDGTPLTEAQSTTFYAALLPAARRTDPAAAARLLEPRLDRGTLTQLLGDRNRYYDHNWVWFGLALDRGLLTARTPPAPAPAP